MIGENFNPWKFPSISILEFMERKKRDISFKSETFSIMTTIREEKLAFVDGVHLRDRFLIWDFTT